MSPNTWHFDPAHTEVGFAVRHLMIATVRGRFDDVRGSVRMDPADPSTAQAEVTIGVASVNTGNPQRDAHLRSADFFDVERFPLLTFRSRGVAVLPDGALRL